MTIKGYKRAKRILIHCINNNNSIFDRKGYAQTKITKYISAIPDYEIADIAQKEMDIFFIGMEHINLMRKIILNKEIKDVLSQINN